MRIKEMALIGIKDNQRRSAAALLRAVQPGYKIRLSWIIFAAVVLFMLAIIFTFAAVN